MSLAERFADAQRRVKALATSPDTDRLLELYALYKQATAGDADQNGKRPGMLDLKGRAKFDAWAKKKGIARDSAMEAYIQVVDQLTGGAR